MEIKVTKKAFTDGMAIIQLLKESICPKCTNTGIIPVTDFSGTPHATPCEWCAHRDHLIGPDESERLTTQ